MRQIQILIAAVARPLAWGWLAQLEMVSSILWQDALVCMQQHIHSHGNLHFYQPGMASSIYSGFSGMHYALEVNPRYWIWVGRACGSGDLKHKRCSPIVFSLQIPWIVFQRFPQIPFQQFHGSLFSDLHQLLFSNSMDRFSTIPTN